MTLRLVLDSGILQKNKSKTLFTIEEGNLIAEIADNYVFTGFIWKFTGLNVILPAIGKWYTFQLLSGTLLDYHIQIIALANLRRCCWVIRIHSAMNLICCDYKVTAFKRITILFFVKNLRKT